MLQANNNTLDKLRCIDLPTVPAGQLLSWLASKPQWMRDSIIKSLSISKR